jgi:Tfp pilus assembly protein PilV
MSSPIENLKAAARNVLIKLRVMFDRVASRHAGLTPSPVPLPAVSESNRPQSPMTRRRRAITLLEVLISMFIMTVGLLSVASLVPVGKVQQSRGDQTVRASACGRAAFREMRIRGILDPKNWAVGHITDGNISNAYDSVAGTFQVSATKFDPANPTVLTTVYNEQRSIVPVVIDPLGVANNFGPWFPFPVATIDYATVTPLPSPNPPLAPGLPRLTLGPSRTGSFVTNAARKAMSEMVLQSADDLIFEEPAKNDALPPQKMQVPSGGSTDPVRRMSKGDYSWLATVVPDPFMVSTANWSTIPCRVSVVVFHNRALTIPGAGERACNLSSLAGSGEIEIAVYPTASAINVGVADQYKGNGEGAAHLDVRPQQWIMIAGWDDKDGLPSPGDRFWQFRWYRVLSTDATLDSTGREVSRQSTGTGRWTKRLTIEGADWNVPTAVMANFLNESRVFLFDGIENVYEKNMSLEID